MKKKSDDPRNLKIINMHAQHKFCAIFHREKKADITKVVHSNRIIVPFTNVKSVQDVISKKRKKKKNEF